MILVLPLYALCAATFTLAKATLAYSLPFFYMGIRMTIAGLLLYGVYMLTYRKNHPIKSSDWWLFTQIMLFNIYFAYSADLWSLQYLTSIESALIFNMSPFIAAFFSYFWFSEVMTKKKWLGLSLGASSIIPLLFIRTNGHVLFGFDRTIPIMVLIGGVTSSAYGWIVMRELVKKRAYSPIMVNGIGMFGGGFAALMTSYMIEPWNPSPVTHWPNFLLLTFAIIIVCKRSFCQFLWVPT